MVFVIVYVLVAHINRRRDSPVSGWYRFLEQYLTRFVCVQCVTFGSQVKVIEKTNEFRRFGGPIQLASNALSCIKAIDPAFFDKLMEHFTFTGIRTNGIKDGIRTEW